MRSYSKNIFRLGKLIREPVTLAFATASSESAYPKVMDALNKFGVPKKVTSFVLPLGYSFNLDGSMMSPPLQYSLLHRPTILTLALLNKS